MRRSVRPSKSPCGEPGGSFQGSLLPPFAWTLWTRRTLWTTDRRLQTGSTLFALLAAGAALSVRVDLMAALEQHVVLVEEVAAFFQDALDFAERRERFGAADGLALPDGERDDGA